jgi:hypothetical protein
MYCGMAHLNHHGVRCGPLNGDDPHCEMLFLPNAYIRTGTRDACSMSSIPAYRLMAADQGGVAHARFESLGLSADVLRHWV